MPKNTPNRTVTSRAAPTSRSSVASHSTRARQPSRSRMTRSERERSGGLISSRQPSSLWPRQTPRSQRESLSSIPLLGKAGSRYILSSSRPIWCRTTTTTRRQPPYSDVARIQSAATAAAMANATVAKRRLPRSTRPQMPTTTVPIHSAAIAGTAGDVARNASTCTSTTATSVIARAIDALPVAPDVCTAALRHCDHDVTLLVPLLDVSVSLDDLLQRIAPVDDRPDLSGLDESL